MSGGSCYDQRDYGMDPCNSPGQNTGVGGRSFLREIFPTRGLNPGLPHCRWILYQLSHNGSPRILEWVDSPFFNGSSQPRNQTGLSCTVGRYFFSNWAIREAQIMDELVINAIYNHVVICSNRNYNSYEVIYILHEYVYVHIRYFLLSLSCLPACGNRKCANTS